jgi:hypothetical protein
LHKGVDAVGLELAGLEARDAGDEAQVVVGATALACPRKQE